MTLVQRLKRVLDLSYGEEMLQILASSRFISLEEATRRGLKPVSEPTTLKSRQFREVVRTLIGLEG